MLEDRYNLTLFFVLILLYFIFSKKVLQLLELQRSVLLKQCFRTPVVVYGLGRALAIRDTGNCLTFLYQLAAFTSSFCLRSIAHEPEGC